MTTFFSSYHPAVLVGVAGLVLLAQCSGQVAEFSLEIPFPAESTQALYKWDPVHAQLILYRDVTDPAFPAARAYDSRFRARAPIYPLKDFPGAIAADLWSVAAGPGGATVVSAVIQYGGLNNKSLLLTYDAHGSLRKLWDVRPYHHHQVAADREGNVYAFGHRDDRGEERNEPDYPLLVKYSPSGNVVWESLPRSAFPYDVEILVTNAETLEHSFVITRDSLVLFVSTTKELLKVDLRDGRINDRSQMSPILNRLAAEAGLAFGKIICLGIAANGDLIAQLRLEPKSPNKPPGFVMAQISRSGSSYTRLGDVLSIPSMGAFLGLDSEGKCLFLKSRNHEHEPLMVQSMDMPP
jgi:hypothetical protein